MDKQSMETFNPEQDSNIGKYFLKSKLWGSQLPDANAQWHPDNTLLGVY